MKQSKIFLIIILSLLLLTLVGLEFGFKPLSIIGHILLLPLVGIYYGSLRDWQFGPVDKYVYLAFLIGSPSDTILFLGLGESGSFGQISLTLMMNLLFIFTFRHEGTTIYSSKLRDIPKLVLPSLFVFLCFGYLIMPSVPDAVYFLSILYAVVLVILVAHGYFRPIKGRSYLWVTLGVTLVLIKDLFYSVYFFILVDQKANLYAQQFAISVFSYLFIAYGLSISQNSNSEKYEKVSLKAIVESLKTVLKSKSKNDVEASPFKFISTRSSKMT